MVVNNPLIRPYFLGGWHRGGTLRFPWYFRNTYSFCCDWVGGSNGWKWTSTHQIWLEDPGVSFMGQFGNTIFLVLTSLLIYFVLDIYPQHHKKTCHIGNASYLFWVTSPSPPPKKIPIIFVLQKSGPLLAGQEWHSPDHAFTNFGEPCGKAQWWWRWDAGWAGTMELEFCVVGLLWKRYGFAGIWPEDKIFGNMNRDLIWEKIFQKWWRYSGSYFCSLMNGSRLHMQRMDGFEFSSCLSELVLAGQSQ